MKTLLATLSLGLALIISGCATTESRISKNQAAFDSWPREVQSAIRSGEVKIGFTTEQVRVALGKPHRVYSRQSAEGESEVWAYLESSPKFSIGVGVGSGGYNSGAVGGVAYTQRHDRSEEATRVVFTDGVVVAIEARTDA
jgi:outer membrane protein assembly factor BamE (lipoprotein component of BamABCDE complex)